MQGFYKLLETLKTQLQNDKFVNTVTTGDIFEVDLSRQTIFPLSHIVVNQCEHEGATLRFNVSIMAMDIVDKSKDETTDVFRGNDNEQDVLNTQLAVLVRLIEVIKKARLNDNLFQLDGNPTNEPFIEAHENYLAGWSCTFDVVIPHDMTGCELPAPRDICDPVLVENSDGSYSVSVASGGVLSLPDTQYDIYVNGVFDQSVNLITLKDETLNITA